MTSLNQDCFLPPKSSRYEAIARGLDPSQPAAGANGGMLAPRRVHLRAGQRLYRFCDSRRASGNLVGEAAGGWWLEYEVFARIRDFARQHEHLQKYAGQFGQSALSYAAKLHLAVPYEWGDSGTVVTADLIRQFDAFRGDGNVALLRRRDARDGGVDYRPLPRAEIWQLYIPEFRNYAEKGWNNLQRWQPGQFLHSHRLA